MTHRWLIGIGVVLALAAALALIGAGGGASLAQGDIIYVDAEAPGPTHDGSSWANAYTDLQLALETAESGQQIWVAAGVYIPTWQVDSDPRSATFQMANDVAIYGGFAGTETELGQRDWVANETILSGDIGNQGDDSDNSFHVFYHPGGLDSTAILDGFTIAGGNAAGDTSPDRDGGGMYNDGSSPTLTNLTFADNSADQHGGGIYNTNNSFPALTGCTFTGNSATYGGGMANYLYAAPVVTNCTFADNTASQGGGGLLNAYFADPVLTNCTFWDNAAGFGGGIYNHYSSPVLTNCTLAGNSVADRGGGIYNTSSSAPVLTNCILWGDTAGGLPSEIDSDASSPVVTYSDVQGSYPGDGNLDAGPLFVDPGTGDLRLQLSSPAIDAGKNGAVPAAVTTDLGGNPRFADVASVTDTGSGDPPIVDMGAYEAPPEIIFVDLEAAGTTSGTSWADAFTDLQHALTWAQEGVEVWVAAGTYRPSQEFAPGDPRSATFQMVNGVAIYGGFDPSAGDEMWEDRDWETNTTILSGDIGLEDDPDDNCYHVFYHLGNLDSTAILDGFTITGGNAAGNYPHYRGGGMFNYESSPTLTNCTFEDNLAWLDAGGMLNWVDSSPTLTNCTFKGNSSNQLGGGMYNIASAPTLTALVFIDNSARDGGGIYNHYSSPVLTNVTFIDNAATWGGGMHDYHSPAMLTNCTFSGNTATYGGGIYNSSSSPILTNCILWSDTGSEIANYSSTPVISYSDIEGGCEAMPENVCGAGNINQDPLFLDPNNDDVHLGPGSPCIDAGDNTPSSLPLQDFEGDPRIRDGNGDGEPVVDMGVDEAFWYPVHLPLVLRAY